MRGVTPPPVQDTFHFHPRVSNPELWRTSLPLIVQLRSKQHKGLIATWIAIHWLIVLNASNGRASFGMREIAAKANVGRNELAGKKGYIHRLVELGLLQIVGYQTIPGFREKCAIYHIDLAELERLSIESVPDLLRQHNLPPPPRPAPSPDQLSLFDSDHAPPAPEPVPANGTGGYERLPVAPANGTGGYAQMPVAPANGTGGYAQMPVAPANGTGARASGSPHLDQTMGISHENGTDVGENGTDQQAHEAICHENGTEAHENGTDQQAYEAICHENGTDVGENGTDQQAYEAICHENGTDDARKRDMEGRREGRKEGGREHARSLALDLHSLTATVTQTVIATLRHQGFVAPQLGAAAELPQIPPQGQPRLPASFLELWHGNRGSVAVPDQHQLEFLAALYDAKTDGHGGYWVGRAILSADSCLREKGRPVSLNYLTGILRRWDAEGSWGSELNHEEPAPTSPKPSRKPGRAVPSAETSVPALDVEPSRDPIPHPSADHPAIGAYTTAFGRTPNDVQAGLIQSTVTDQVIWQRVLTEWKANGWQEAAVAKMVDRYRKEAGLGAPAEPESRLSVGVIHEHPDLTSEQCEQWIMRYHRAETPAEKRAVLARLHQEHPV